LRNANPYWVPTSKPIKRLALELVIRIKAVVTYEPLSAEHSTISFITNNRDAPDAKKEDFISIAMLLDSTITYLVGTIPIIVLFPVLFVMSTSLSVACLASIYIYIF
jgi:hypothetical protein